MSQSLRQVRFSDACWPADDDISFLTDVIAHGQVQNLLAIDGWIETEVEGFQSFGGIQRPPPQPQGELFLRPPFHFVLQEALQKLDVGPFSVYCLTMTRFQRFQHPGEAQLLELGRELMFQFHRAAPNSAPNISVGGRTKALAGGETGAS